MTGSDALRVVAVWPLRCEQDYSLRCLIHIVEFLGVGSAGVGASGPDMYLKT